MNNYYCHVYCLFRPHESQPFYFGMTDRPRAREKEHRRRYGRDTYFALLHTFDCRRDAGECEQEYISRYLAKGVPILNKAAGWTPEAKANKSLKTKAQWAAWRERSSRRFDKPTATCYVEP